MNGDKTADLSNNNKDDKNSIRKALIIIASSIRCGKIFDNLASTFLDVSVVCLTCFTQLVYDCCNVITKDELGSAPDRESRVSTDSVRLCVMF